MSPDPSRIPDEFARRLVGHVDTIVHLYCRLLPGHDQQDVAQDALTALVEGWRAGSCPAEPLSWLVAVVRKIHARRCRVRWRDRGVISLSTGPGEDDAAPVVPACGADPWAELRQLLDDVTPPFSESDKAELLGLASGDGRGDLARDRGESVRTCERRLKKNLERLSFFLTPGKRC